VYDGPIEMLPEPVLVSRGRLTYAHDTRRLVLSRDHGRGDQRLGRILPAAKLNFR
jgi:hypothetical protein